MSTPELLSHYVDGEWVRGEASFESLNPSDTRDVVARAALGQRQGDEFRGRRRESRVRGLGGRQPRSAQRRAGQESAPRFWRARKSSGRLLSREEGKTLAEGIGEVARAGRIFKFFAGEALRRTGVTVDSTRPGVEAATYREPVGVFGLITPWNFPIAIPAWKSAPALAFGNTVVMKPASLTPALAVALAKIIHESGAPKGVFNLVIGGGAAGDALTGNPDVAGISLHGLTAGRRARRDGRGEAAGAPAAGDGRQEARRSTPHRGGRPRSAALPNVGRRSSPPAQPACPIRAGRAMCGSERRVNGRLNAT